MTITELDLDEARKAWGDGLVEISIAHETSGGEVAKQVATRVIGDVYGYELGPVLFKPTMSAGEQTFRLTKAGALSYFVAQDPTYPDDAGFALKGWRTVTTDTAASFVEGDVAMWMGFMSFTDRNGETTVVDKSFGYRLDTAGRLKIVLHHSSFGYRP